MSSGVKTREIHEITNTFDIGSDFFKPSEALSFTLTNSLYSNNSTNIIDDNQHQILLNNNNKHLIHSSDIITESIAVIASSTLIHNIDSPSVIVEQPKVKRYKQNESNSPLLLSAILPTSNNNPSPLKLVPNSSQSIFLSYLETTSSTDQNDLEVFCNDLSKDEISLPFLESNDQNNDNNLVSSVVQSTAITLTSSSSSSSPTLIDFQKDNQQSNNFNIDFKSSSVDLCNHVDNVDNLIFSQSLYNEISINQNNNNQQSNVTINSSNSCVPFLHNIPSPDNAADVRKSMERNVPEEEEDVGNEGEEEEEEEVFNPWVFMKHLSSISHTPPNKLMLPPKDTTSPKISLVLDLDETLVHCSTDPIDEPDLTFLVTFNGIEYKVFAKKRPFFEEFLLKASSLFEVIIFTASQEVYANKLLNMIDPNNYIKYRLFRDSCVYVEGNYLKDLSILGRDLSQVVIVDNSPQSFGFQVDNGIPIESWFEDINDKELVKLFSFLESLQEVDDVRPLIRTKFGVQDLIDNS